MPDQPEPSTVESGPVELRPASGAPTTQESSEEPAPSASNGEPGDQTSGDDGEFVSLEELQKMSEPDLRQFIADNGLTPPVEADSQQDLLDWLLSEYGVSV